MSRPYHTFPVRVAESATPHYRTLLLEKLFPKRGNVLLLLWWHLRSGYRGNHTAEPRLPSFLAQIPYGAPFA